MAARSRELELLAAKIQKQLSPDAEIIHDAKLPGRRSRVQRQIDVLVKQRIGQYEMLVVLECKDYARPVDVKGVEEFHGLLDDVGAHKGAMVCPRGFTAAARERARDFQVDLYSPVDTDPHKWQARVEIPTICDFRSARFSIGISCSAPVPLTIPFDYYEKLVAYDGDQPLGTPATVATKKWEEGDFPIEPGVHEDIDLYPQPEVLVDNGHGMRVPVRLYASVWVEQSLYFGNLPVCRMSGFKDELSGGVITNAFTIGLIRPEEVEQTWLRIKDVSDAPVTPLVTLRGLISYGEIKE